MSLRARVVVCSAAAAVTVAIASAAIGDARAPVLFVTSRLSADVNAPPFDFARPSVRCPRGYVATGGSAWPGANDTVYDTPDSDMRGWSGSFFNNSTTTAYPSQVEVVCAKGNTNGLSVKAALNRDRRLELERQVRAKHGRR